MSKEKFLSLTDKGTFSMNSETQINVGNAAGRCRKMLGKIKVTSIISRQTSTFPVIFIFQ